MYYKITLYKLISYLIILLSFSIFAVVTSIQAMMIIGIEKEFMTSLIVSNGLRSLIASFILIIFMFSISIANPKYKPDKYVRRLIKVSIYFIIILLSLLAGLFIIVNICNFIDINSIENFKQVLLQFFWIIMLDSVILSFSIITAIFSISIPLKKT